MRRFLKYLKASCEIPSINKYIEKPEAIFLIVATMFGLATSLITPPMVICDEPRHFMRIHQIANGDIMPKKRGDILGGMMPSNMVKIHEEITSIIFTTVDNKRQFHRLSDVYDLLEQNSELEEMAFFANTAVFSPIGYLPQLTAATVARFLCLKPITSFYMQRLANLFFFIIVVFVAIRVAPIFKWMFALLALTPMAMHESGSIAADGFTNSISFFFIAYILSLSLKDNEICRKELITVCLLGLLLSLSKYTFIAIIGAVVIIPGSRFKNRKQHLLFISGFFLLCVIPALSWYISIRTYYYVPLRFENTDPGMQLQYILQNPFQYVQVLARTLECYWNDILVQYIGVLGWLDVELPRALIITYLAMIFFFATNSNGETGVLFCWQKTLLLVVFLSGMILLFTASYLGYNRVGSDMVRVIEGRYIIPFMPLFFLLFKNAKVHLIDGQRKLGLIVFTYTMAVSVVSMQKIADYYY